MKKQNKQVNQKQKQSILNAARMLKDRRFSFDGNNHVSTEEVPYKIRFFGRKADTYTVYTVNGFRVTDEKKIKALLTINPDFLEEVSNFLEKEPNNEYAQRITKTLTKGVNFE